MQERDAVEVIQERLAQQWIEPWEGPKYLEITAPLQNSIEIGQTSKKDWYVKSIKLFFGSDEEDRLDIIGQLFSLKDRAEAILKG